MAADRTPRAYAKIQGEESALIKRWHQLPLREIAERLVKAGHQERELSSINKHIYNLGLRPLGRVAEIALQAGLTEEILCRLALRGISARKIADRYPPVTADQVLRLHRKWGIPLGYPKEQEETRKARQAALRAAAPARPTPEPPAVPRTIYSAQLGAFLPDDDALEALYGGRHYRDITRADVEAIGARHGMRRSA